MLNLRFASVLDPLAEVCLPLTIFIGFVLVPLIVVLPIVFLLDLLYPVKPLGSQHSSRTKGVRLRGPRNYEFDNPAYAKLFALNNGEQARFLLSTTVNKLFNSPYRLELKIRKTPLNYKIRGKSLLRGKPLVEIMGLSAIFSIVLMIVFSVAFTFFFEPPTAGNPGTYIFGSLGLLMTLVVCFAIVDHTGTLS